MIKYREGSHYRSIGGAYGLQLSSNRAVPGVHTLVSGTTTQIQITFAPSTPMPDRWCSLSWRPYTRDENGVADVEMWYAKGNEGRHCYRIRFNSPDAYADYIADLDADQIWVGWESPLEDEELVFQGICSLLLGRVLGNILRLQGQIVLHASAVAIDGQAFLFMGQQGSGKSTLAAALIARGERLLADDLAVLTVKDARFVVQPGPTRLRLWPTSLKMLEPVGDPLPLVLPDVEKRYIEASFFNDNGDQDAVSSLPLGGVYVLMPRDLALKHPRIESLSPKEGLRWLLLNRYGSIKPEPPEAVSEFRRLAQISEKTLIWSVERPGSLANMPELVDAIVANSSSLH